MTGARARRVDAHQHFWRLARGDYGWLTPAKGPIYRDFGPADLTPLLARAGIDATVLVQAAPTVDETRFLLELARTTPVVAGVVGWAPLDAPDAPDVVAELARTPALKGLRPMLHDIPDVDWMLRPEVARGPPRDRRGGPHLRRAGTAAASPEPPAAARAAPGPPRGDRPRRQAGDRPGRAGAVGNPHGRPRPRDPRVGQALGPGHGGRAGVVGRAAPALRRSPAGVLRRPSA